MSAARNIFTSNRFVQFWLFLSLFTLAIPCVNAAEPIKLHPDNPHYFLFRGQPTVLITSGEHYGAVINLDFDYMPYLDELVSKGLNLTRAFSGFYLEINDELGIEKNTLAPLPNRFIAPWARSSTPGYINGGNKFDLSKWDEAYFQRLKDFVSEAGKRGIVVELVFFCVFYNDNLWSISPINPQNNINNIPVTNKIEPYVLRNAAITKVQEDLVNKIVQELNGFDNVYYEIINEPYFGGVTEKWQGHILSTIVAAESALPSKHLIAKNIANGSQIIRNASPEISIFNFHYAFPPDAVKQNYALNRVIAFDETGFAGSGDEEYRKEGWAFLLSGGSVFDNLDYSFTIDKEDGTDTQTAPGGGSPALRSQLSILKNFMTRIDFIRMAPNPSVVAQVRVNGLPVSPATQNTRYWVLAEEGKTYAIYLTKGTQAQFTLNIPAGTYQADWVNPKTGAIDKSETVHHTGGSMIVESPDYVEDIALRIESVPSHVDDFQILK